MNTPTPRERFRKTLDISTGVSELLADSNASYISWLERELTAAREELAELKEEYGTWWAQKRIAIDELKEVTEQRDSIDSMYHKVIKEVLECDPIPACQREDDQLEPPWEVIARVREQRDRLAEALRKAISWGDSASHHILYRQNINWTYLNEAREALQSLNPDHTVAANDMIAAVKGGNNES